MSQGTGWEPPDIRARRPADPNLYRAYPPPPPGFAPLPRQPRPPMPGSVRGAVRLMWLATILTALQGVVVCSIAADGTGYGRFYLISGGAYVESNGYRTTDTGITYLMVSTLVFCGLWLWMLIMCRLGRNWARIVSSVFFGLCALSTISLVQSGTPGFDRFAGVTITLIGMMVVILLWVSDSTPYFRPAAVAPAWGWGQPGYPGHPGQPGSAWPAPAPAPGNPYQR